MRYAFRWSVQPPDVESGRVRSGRSHRRGRLGSRRFKVKAGPPGSYDRVSSMRMTDAWLRFKCWLRGHAWETIMHNATFDDDGTSITERCGRCGLYRQHWEEPVRGDVRRAHP
jgi:hypothetical protein